jgi:hypothetical protein
VKSSASRIPRNAGLFSERYNSRVQERKQDSHYPARALATSRLVAKGTSRALLNIRRTNDAARMASGAPTNASFVTAKKRVPIHIVASGVNHTALGGRPLRAALIDRIIVLTGKTKTNPTRILPMKMPRIGEELGVSKPEEIAPRVSNDRANLSVNARIGTPLTCFVRS